MNSKRLLIFGFFLIMNVKLSFGQIIKFEYEEISSLSGIEIISIYLDIDNEVCIDGYGSLFSPIFDYKIYDYKNKVIKYVNTNNCKYMVDPFEYNGKSNRLELLDQKCNEEKICNLKYMNYVYSPFVEGDTGVCRLDVEVDFDHELSDKIFTTFDMTIPSIEATQDNKRGIILYYNSIDENRIGYSADFVKKLIGYSFTNQTFDMSYFEEVETMDELWKE